MTQQINVDPNKRSDYGGLLSGIGTVLGAVAAPLTAGASLAPTLLGTVAAGAGLGSAAGKLTGTGIDAVNNSKGEGAAPVGMSGQTAIQRRMDQSKGANPFEHIQDALNVVNTLPSGLKEQYAKPLEDATQKFKQPATSPGTGRSMFA